ncbi:MAG: PEP/pyruvate-binding domain-containing protein [Acidimicrobiia bacterium]|nr:PEP/pyruvate-binding domain-containing protein [Acidimicrobiia bacterium]
MAGERVLTVEIADGGDSKTVGGKAAGLSRLAERDLPVPPGLIIPVGVPDADLEAAAIEIARRFPGERLAVRSSAVAEDLAEASFAGQYETVLGVHADPDGIAAAARRVRSSVDASHVGGYAGSRPAGMAVLVMPMVDAAKAGVAFTRDPLTGESVVVVEAVEGLGDRLASGEASGERWRVAASAEPESGSDVLDPDEAASVASLALRCEEALGTAQDIEWAITADGGVVLLQSRPITTVDDVEPIPMDDPIPPGPWEWDSTHNRLPVTPLTSSTFAPAFAAASRNLAETYGIPASHLEMRAINGYLYIQVVPPAGKPGQPNPPAFVMRAMFNVIPLLRSRRKAAQRAMSERVDRSLRAEWMSEVKPQTEATLDRWFDVSLSDLSDAQLAELLVEAVELQRATFGWNMVTDPSYLLPLADLHGFVEEHFGRGMETTTRLLAGASPSEYLESALHVAAVMSPEEKAAAEAGGGIHALGTEAAVAYEAHLRAHGQKVRGFDLSNATHLEDADRELARIATMRAPDDPSIQAANLADDLRSQLGTEAAAEFDQLLAEARATYPIREAGEGVHGRVMGVVRLAALEAGDRMVRSGNLVDREHVVFLELDELTSWLDSRHDVSDVIRIRRGNDLWAKGRSPEPYLGPEVPMPPLEAFPPEVRSVMRMFEIISTHDMRPADLADGVDGVPASPGVYTGPVRLVEGPHEFHKVQQGDVLVAPITMSPWEVLFPHVGALVTEGGGLLSHPAIVAREYSLPAIVGCEGAMARFHDGQIVRVDGAAGTVTPVEAD